MQESTPKRARKKYQSIRHILTEDLVRLYCDEMLSLRGIGDIYSTSVTTVKRELELRGIPVRSSIEAHWSRRETTARAVKDALTGLKRSEETKSKLRQRVITAAWKEKIRIARAGQVFSAETNEKRRQTMLGKPGPNRGRTFGNETRKRMSEAGKGRIFTAEHRAALSKAGKGHPPWPGSHKSKIARYDTQDGRSIVMASSYEYAVAKYLDSIDEPWEYTGRSLSHSFLLSDGRRYYPDFFLPRLDMYIDPKGWVPYKSRPKYDMLFREYPGRVVFLVGTTYLDQLRKLLCRPL